MNKQIKHHVNVLRAFASAGIAGGRGMNGTAFPKQPEKPLKLYEFEACPFCRRVREVITLLNLDVQIYPCPDNGTRFRPLVQQLGGKTQFPFLIDENTGDKLYESKDIIAHLFKHYSQSGKVPLSYQFYPPVPVVGMASTLVGLAHHDGVAGHNADKANASRPAPKKLLELWSFEASPYSKVVRARLTELEIPYILHSVAKERWQDQGPAALRLKPGKYTPLAGGKREKVLQRLGGRIQVPYLEDPNTGAQLFESADILDYLNSQYAS